MNDNEDIRHGIPDATESGHQPVEAPSAAPAAVGGAEDASSKENAPKGRKPKKHLIRPTWLRRTVKILFGLVVAVVLLPFTIYIPPIQNFLKNVACSQVKKSTGMDVSIERFRLGFPLDVRLEKLLVLDEHRDTMVRAGSLVADVKLMPLLKGNLELNDVELREGYYRMVNEDSSMYLTIDAGFLKVDGGSSMNLKSQGLNLINPVLRDARIDLVMDVWKAKPDTVQEPSTMVIRSGNITLDNVSYGMKMRPYIADLNALFKKATVKDLVVDLKNSKLSVGSVKANGGDVVYTTPTPEYVRTHPAPVDTISPPSPPFVVELGEVDLKGFRALYNTEGVKPAAGFDAAYIEVKDLDISLHDFYNCASTVRVPIASLKGSERSGINVQSASGTVAIDSLGIALQTFAVSTDVSKLDFDAQLSYDMMDLKPEGSLSAKGGGYLGLADLGNYMPSLKSTLLFVPASSVGLDIDVEGTLGALTVNNLGVDLPGVMHVNAGGFVQNALDFDRLKALLDIEGALKNASPVNKYLNKMGVRLPRFSLKGKIGADAGTYTADLNLKSPEGNIALDGTVSLSAERYDADVEVHSLDVADLMTSLGVGVVDGKVYAVGSGFNPTLPKARTHIEADINRADYGGFSYGPLTLDADVENSIYEVALASTNKDMDLDLNARGTMRNGTYDIDATTEIHHLDLKAMGLMDSVCAGSGFISLNGTANPDKMLFDLDMAVRDIDWAYGSERLLLPHAADASFLATADSTSLRVKGYDLDLAVDAPVAMGDLMGDFMDASSEISQQIDSKNFDFAALHTDLPKFRLTALVGGKGVVRQFVEPTGYSFDTLTMTLDNGDIIDGDIMLAGLNTGKLLIDSVKVALRQKESRLNYRVGITNLPPNLTEFANVTLSGYLEGNRASLALRQRNAKNEEGYRLGLTAAYADSVLSLHFTPLNATIGYKPWIISDDNYVQIGPGKIIRSSLEASSLGSSISLQSGMTDKNDNYLDVAIKNLDIEDFLQMSAFAPPLTGRLNTDLHLELRKRGVIGNGNLTLDEFYYDKVRVGDIGADFRAGSNLANVTGGKIDFSLDGEHIMALRGFTRADSVTGANTTKLTLDLDTFPLRMLNPFIGPDMAQLKGALNGSLALSGSLTAPVLNGDLRTTGVSVYIPMAGSSIHIADGEALNVVDNLLTLDNIRLTGANDNPLTLSGSVDARNFSDILLDLALSGRNVVLVDNDRRARSDIFGKLAVNLDATVRGSMKRLSIGANLSILSSTNITYVLGTDASTLERQNTTDVVKFVQFNDTTQVAVADSVPPSMLMDINATLNIVNGAQFTVNLNTSGTNRARLLPNGTLNYTQSFMGDKRLNGQLNIPSGQVRYTPPLMTEKVFDFLPESYVSWSGNMMNPTLHLLARDHLKANVQQQGSNSRLIYFDVGLSVLGTLSAPKVTFDLSTDDDITVHNELLSMTPEQRSNEAMNLLLYNTYTGPGVTASSNLSGNPLYGFLTGQLNSWAARTIRGVDLSFGIDQYKNTYEGETSTATSYSYQVSKSLFDNRFKIVVGGNYTTNANADENFVQNLISDISFEYMLKQTNTMSIYMRLFRHTGWESILEGEITETGVGFVMKRKLDNLLQLFRFRRKKKAPEAAPADSVPKETPVATDTIVK